MALGCNGEIPSHSSRSSISASSDGLNLQFQKQGQIPHEGFYHYVNAANISRKPDIVSQISEHPQSNDTFSKM